MNIKPANSGPEKIRPDSTPPPPGGKKLKASGFSPSAIEKVDAAALKNHSFKKVENTNTNQNQRMQQAFHNAAKVVFTKQN